MLLNITIASLLMAFLLVMIASSHVRAVLNEIWSHYVINLLVNLLRFSWPYFLIWAVWDVISNGTLAQLFRSTAAP